MSRPAVLLTSLLLALGLTPAAASAVASSQVKAPTLAKAGPGGGWCC